MVIDAHAHVDEYTLFGWCDPPEKAVELMDGAGIDKMMVTTYGEGPDYPKALSVLLDSVQKFPGRFIPFIRINPMSPGAVEYLEQVKSEHPKEIYGLKIHPVANFSKPYGHQTIALLRKCGEMNMPVSFHCGDELGSYPWQLGAAAEACPETTILCHIGGFFHNEEMIRVAQCFPNIMLDTSSIPYPYIVEKAVDALGAERICFASDSPAGDPKLDLHKITRLHFPSQIEERILFRNFAEMVGLEV